MAALSPDFGIGILNYGTRELLLACIEQCLEDGVPRDRLLVWDNASADGSATAVGERFPGVRCVASKENLGYAGGMNAIVKMFQTRWVVLLTADCTIDRPSLEQLLKVMDSEPQAAVGGCRILDRRTGRVQSEGGDVTFPLGIPLSRTWQRDVAAAGPGADSEVAYVDGAVLVVDREKFTELGGFDDSYFAYYDDVDLCWRARLRGYRVVCVGSASALHATSASFGDRASLRWFLTERNRIASNVKNLGLANLFVALVAEGVYAAAILASAGRLGPPGYRRAYGKAWVATASRLASLLSARTKVQRSRALPDEPVVGRHLRMGWRPLAKALSERSALAIGRDGR